MEQGASACCYISAPAITITITRVGLGRTEREIKVETDETWRRAENVEVQDGELLGL